MRKLSHTDRRGIAVTRNANAVQLAIGQVRAGCNGRHTPVNRIEAVRFAEEIRWRFDAANPRYLREPMRADQLRARLHDCGTDGIVAAPGAQCRYESFVVTSSQTQVVELELGVMYDRFGNERHRFTSDMRASLLTAKWFLTAVEMKSAEMDRPP
jgi:hypothetical protein